MNWPAFDFHYCGILCLLKEVTCDARTFLRVCRSEPLVPCVCERQRGIVCNREHVYCSQMLRGMWRAGMQWLLGPSHPSFSLPCPLYPSHASLSKPPSIYPSDHFLSPSFDFALKISQYECSPVSVWLSSSPLQVLLNITWIEIFKDRVKVIHYLQISSINCGVQCPWLVVKAEGIG